MKRPVGIESEFVHGFFAAGSPRKFASVDHLASKYALSRSTVFQWAQKEDWHGKRIVFQKKLAAELSRQAIASSINKAETIDTAILRVAARGLHLIEEKFDSDSNELSPTELKHLLGAAADAQRLTDTITAHLETFADQNIEEESEKALRGVIAILDEVAAIKSSQANHTRQ